MHGTLTRAVNSDRMRNHDFVDVCIQHAQREVRFFSDLARRYLLFDLQTVCTPEVNDTVRFPSTATDRRQNRLSEGLPNRRLWRECSGSRSMSFGITSSRRRPRRFVAPIFVRCALASGCQR
jgi:hypothetical protein